MAREAARVVVAREATRALPGASARLPRRKTHCGLPRGNAGEAGQSRLPGPAAMARLTLSLTPTLTQILTLALTLTHHPHPHLPLTLSPGMFGSGRDLLRFLGMLASGGTIDGTRLLTDASVRLLLLRLLHPLRLLRPLRPLTSSHTLTQP